MPIDDAELRVLIERARVKAAEVGSMHPLWDVIIDAEIHLGIKSGRAICSRTDCEEVLGRLRDV